MINELSIKATDYDNRGNHEDYAKIIMKEVSKVLNIRGAGNWMNTAYCDHRPVMYVFDYEDKDGRMTNTLEFLFEREIKEWVITIDHIDCEYSGAQK